MSEPALHLFRGAGGLRGLALPFELDAWVQDWTAVQRTIVRRPPEGWTRNDAAYVAAALDRDALLEPYIRVLGEPAPSTGGAPWPPLVYRPAGEVGVWLPNNVSLLGPLVLVLLGGTGCPVTVKTGSRAADLVGPLVNTIREALPADRPLARFVSHHLRVLRVDRSHPAVGELAARARTRIVFGADNTQRAVEALEHPLHSVQVSLSHRRSVAWVDSAPTDDVLATLVRVFTIFGQAGCTSPSRVVLLGAEVGQLASAVSRLATAWARTTDEPAWHDASDTAMATQVARARGWSTTTVDDNRGVIAWGMAALPDDLPGRFCLQVVAAPGIHDAMAMLPRHAQTVGHALPGGPSRQFLGALVNSHVKRVVPLERMHHFSSTWDGQDLFLAALEPVPMS